MRYESDLGFSRSYLSLTLILLSGLSIGLNIEVVRAQAIDRTATPKVTPTPSLPRSQSPSPSPSPGKLAPSPPASRPVSATDTFTVKRFNFVGNKLFSSKQLSTLLARYTNRPLTLDDLPEVYGRITNFYANHGHLRAYAYVPAQTFYGDALTIRVVESGHPE